MDFQAFWNILEALRMRFRASAIPRGRRKMMCEASKLGRFLEISGARECADYQATIGAGDQSL